MQKRAYGKSNIELSIIGFGGILVTQTEPDEASRLVARAIERGINYFDVAPSYGNAEECLGPALEPYRNDVFLACKTTERSRAGAERELQQSLKNMRSEHFDLYQLHAMTTRADFEQATAADGALPFLAQAREKGLIRHIGFSAHSAEIALALLDYFPFDSVLFPLNWTHYFQANFGPQVVKKAEEKGVALLALKALAYGKIAAGEDKPYAKCWYRPIDEPDLADLALRFTLSQPITAAIPPGDIKFFDMALDIADNFRPVDASEIEELRRRSAEAEPMFRLEEAA
jgi:aryl-alcohol dehydrogenase-like predicted oxidoreductase